MPVSDDFFEPKAGDKFVRSVSGLAYSDREIKEMRDWIEQCDAILPDVFSQLADCLSAATACMHPVTKAPDWQTTEPLSALSDHGGKLSRLRAAVERLAKNTKFQKVPFFDRHFIPSGGMPDGLNARDFDGTRNDERVYDTARKKAIAKAKAAKAVAEKKKVGAAADEDRPSRNMHAVAVDEYVGKLTGPARKRFQTRLGDADFAALASGVIDSCSRCLAAAASGMADKMAEGERRLQSFVGSDADLRTMAHHYFDNAKETVSELAEGLGLTKGDEKKALAEIAKQRLRFDKAFEAATVASKKTKKPSRKKA